MYELLHVPVVVSTIITIIENGINARNFIIDHFVNNTLIGQVDINTRGSQ